MQRFVMWIERFVDDDGVPMGAYKLKPLHRADLRRPWLQGARIAEVGSEPVSMRIEVDDEEAGFFADYAPGDVPLVSGRLRESLTRAGVDNVQYFPVVLSNAGDFDSVPDYWAFNVVGCVAVADAGRSSGNQAFGADGATLFDEFHARVGLDEAPHCFRSRESASTVVVSEQVRQACLASGIDTVAFVPIDDWFA